MKNILKWLTVMLLLFSTKLIVAQTCPEPAPDALSITAASPTTLTAEWTEVTTADLYEVTAVDIATGLEVYSAIEGSTTHTITGLSPNKDYEVCVAPACDPVNVSCNTTCAQGHTLPIIIEVIVMSIQPQQEGILTVQPAGTTDSRNAMPLDPANSSCTNNYRFEVFDPRNSATTFATFEMSFPALAANTNCQRIRLDHESMTLANQTDTGFTLSQADWYIHLQNFDVQRDLITFDYSIADPQGRFYQVRVLREP